MNLVMDGGMDKFRPNGQYAFNRMNVHSTGRANGQFPFPGGQYRFGAKEREIERDRQTEIQIE